MSGIQGIDVLIDTNVFIEREGDWTITEALQELENLLRTNGFRILVHPLSKTEIRNYENEERRRTAISKIATYAELTYPAYPTSGDAAFLKKLPDFDTFNERVDNSLLYSVYSGEVDYLITEDGGIHEKADRLGISDIVLTIEEGRTHFKEEPPDFGGPPSIQKAKVRDLDVDDPIFDSLKGEYDFESWFESIPDRTAYVNWNPDGSLGAVLILKENETEQIGHDPPLEERERLKICTMKVAKNKRGSKIGELLISISINEAMNHGLEEIYLTHRVQDEDYLVRLISQYGFTNASDKQNGESVFLKRLTPGLGDDPSPMETNIRFYPSVYDGPEVQKFIVPIRPEFHSRLFQTYDKRQPKLPEFGGQFHSEGNAIKKAYLTHAPIRKIQSGDILLFYRSHDHKVLTSLCVCEQIEYEVDSAQKVKQLVGRRSVFTDHEIREMVESPVTVILFKWHFDLETPLHYQELLDSGVLDGAPRSIQGVDENSYEYIKTHGGLDERFIIN